MAQADLLTPPKGQDICTDEGSTTPAVGLFGFSVEKARMQSARSSGGYLRDIEQMPNFALPSIEHFVEHYVASNIGRSKSSS